MSAINETKTKQLYGSDNPRAGVNYFEAIVWDEATSLGIAGWLRSCIDDDFAQDLSDKFVGKSESECIELVKREFCIETPDGEIGCWLECNEYFDEIHIQLLKSFFNGLQPAYFSSDFEERYSRFIR